jgi:hypothetical protein
MTLSTRLDPLLDIGSVGKNASLARFPASQRDNSSLAAAAATASSGGGAFPADFMWTRAAAMGLISRNCSLDGMMDALKQSQWAKPRATLGYSIDPDIRFIEELVAFHAFNRDKDGALSILIVLHWFLTHPRLWLFAATSAVHIFIISCTKIPKLIAKAADRPSPPPPLRSKGNWLGCAAFGTGAAVTGMGFAAKKRKKTEDVLPAATEAEAASAEKASAEASKAEAVAEPMNPHVEIGNSIVDVIELAFTPCGPSSSGPSVGSTQPDDYAERPTIAIGPPEMIRVHLLTTPLQWRRHRIRQWMRRWRRQGSNCWVCASEAAWVRMPLL